MPQQTKTEALEELARLIRRDIMNGTARLNETWWFDDDTKMQDRIAHVLLDYSDEEKPTELSKVSYNSRLDVFCAQIDELTEKCAALVVERDQLRRQMVSFVEDPAQISTPFGLLPINSAGMRRLLDEIVTLREARDATPLRIDTDMSDPQPGKLLVVRLDADDVGRGWVELGDLAENGRGKDTQNFWPEQRVGFLVETPAVKRVVNEEWVAVRDGRGWTPHFSTPRENPCFATDVESAELFATEEIADARCRMLKGTVGGPWRAVTVDEGRKIAAEVVPFAISKEVLA